jgi:hypothetical protein
MHNSGHVKRTHFTNGSDKMILRYVYEKPFTVRFPHRSEWEEKGD